MTLLQLLAKATQLGWTITFSPDPLSQFTKIEVRNFHGDRAEWRRVSSLMIQYCEPHHVEPLVVEQLTKAIKTAGEGNTMRDAFDLLPSTRPPRGE